jgi:hypothetical protein
MLWHVSVVAVIVAVWCSYVLMDLAACSHPSAEAHLGGLHFLAAVNIQLWAFLSEPLHGCGLFFLSAVCLRELVAVWFLSVFLGVEPLCWVSSTAAAWGSTPPGRLGVQGSPHRPALSLCPWDVTSHIECLFLRTLPLYIFGEVSIFLHILDLFFHFWLLCIFHTLRVWDVSSSSNVWLTNIFSILHSVGCVFTCWIVSFETPNF